MDDLENAQKEIQRLNQQLEKAKKENLKQKRRIDEQDAQLKNIKNKKRRVLAHNYTESEAIFRCALSFNHANDLLGNTLADKIDGITNNSGTDNALFELQAARLTNESFTIELLLKCLYSIENCKLKEGHCLKELFYEDLSEESKQEIKVSYNFLCAFDSRIQGFKNLPEYDGSLDFDRLLDDIKDAFIYNRYIFEPNKPLKIRSNIGVGEIKKAIINRIFKLKPFWISHYTSGSFLPFPANFL